MFCLDILTQNSFQKIHTNVLFFFFTLGDHAPIIFKHVIFTSRSTHRICASSSLKMCTAMATPWQSEKSHRQTLQGQTKKINLYSTSYSFQYFVDFRISETSFESLHVVDIFTFGGKKHLEVQIAGPDPFFQFGPKLATWHTADQRQ